MVGSGIEKEKNVRVTQASQSVHKDFYQKSSDKSLLISYLRSCYLGGGGKLVFFLFFVFLYMHYVLYHIWSVCICR